jgi:hypothetical protein
VDPLPWGGFGGSKWRHEYKCDSAKCRKCGSNLKYCSNPINQMKKPQKKWIAGAIGKPGALHRELGVKIGHKIPAATLAAAAKKGGIEGKRARLAETLKSFNHKSRR